jgi:hypothetical protein
MVDDYLWLMVRKYLSGWWYTKTPLKNDGVKVSWDDEIPKIRKNKIHVPNHQPDKYSLIIKHVSCQ